MFQAVVNADRLPLGAAPFGSRLGPLATATAPPAAASAASPARTIRVVAPVGIHGPWFARLPRRLRVTIVERLAVAVAGARRRTVVVENSLGTTAFGFEAFAGFGSRFSRVLPIAAATATTPATATPAAGPIILAALAFGPRGPLELAIRHRPRRIGPSFGPFLDSLFDP